MKAFVITVCFLFASVSCSNLTNFTFPEGFMLGVATASYQVEGAWNVDGKGESIWDNYCHTDPNRISDHTNGDDACKSYYKYEEDVKAIKDMGMDFYRFSISWPRILPNGLPNNVNQKGIDYYNKLINALIKNGIQPVVTMYHWDLPQYLQNLGGWANRIMVDMFEIYARILFKNFGDRVKYWITFNEPEFICTGYGTTLMAPGVPAPGFGPYLAGHNLILSHARVYHLYNKEFRATQNGSISIAPHSFWALPLNINSTSDKEAAEDFMKCFVGWFAHPIYSKEGDYPKVLKDIVAKRSKELGFPKSRLPEFTPEEIEYIKGTADYFGVNAYTVLLLTREEKHSNTSGLDLGLRAFSSKKWKASKTSSWDTVAPLTVRKVLNWIRDNYGQKWRVLITENGFADDGKLNDTSRIDYLATYLTEILKAIHIDKVNVMGYTVWAAIDNFEWTAGYTSKWGLYHVDFNDPERPRVPKQSSYFMKNVTTTRSIPSKYLSLDQEYDKMIMSPEFRTDLQVRAEI